MPMERKKSQLLFNFLPQDTFNHASNGVIGRVQKLYRDRDEDVSNLPIQLIHQRIVPFIERWDGRTSVQPGDIELVPPGGAYFDIFPRVFECHRCSACTHISQDDMEQGGQPSCGGCGKSLTDTEQLPFVLVCKCGELDSVPLPRCSSCGSVTPRLDRKTSRLEDARWICTSCSTPITETAYEHIQNCQFCGQGRRIKVHSSSSTFYPQSEKFVNVAKENYQAAANAPGFQHEIIVNYLLDEGGITRSADVAEESNELTSAMDNLDIDSSDLEELGIGMDDLKQLEKQAAEKQADERDRMRERVEGMFDEQTRRAISVELFEYRSVLGDEGSDADASSLDALLDGGSGQPSLTSGTRQGYRQGRDDLNLSRINLVEGFPITTVVYGYSRLENRPTDGVHLKTFFNQSAGASFFVQTAETEALHFTLDPEKVISWLDQFEFFDRSEIDTSNDEWFLRNLCGYSRRAPLSDEEIGGTRVQELTLTLLHSYSHAIITAMDALSGYSQGSLVEYLMPHTLSFVVYKRSQTDFNIGAMHTLIESRFEELHQHLKDDADICIYDPVCETEEDGSCEGCLFTSNMTCSVRNLNLSRSVLYGGSFNDYEIETGYFDVE